MDGSTRIKAGAKKRFMGALALLPLLACSRSGEKAEQVETKQSTKAERQATVETSPFLAGCTQISELQKKHESAATIETIRTADPLKTCLLNAESIAKREDDAAHSWRVMWKKALECVNHRPTLTGYEGCLDAMNAKATCPFVLPKSDCEEALHYLNAPIALPLRLLTKACKDEFARTHVRRPGCAVVPRPSQNTTAHGQACTQNADCGADMECKKERCVSEFYLSNVQYDLHEILHYFHIRKPKNGGCPIEEDVPLSISFDHAVFQPDKRSSLGDGLMRVQCETVPKQPYVWLRAFFLEDVNGDGLFAEYELVGKSQGDELSLLELRYDETMAYE
jgi:hypothetical protein